MQASEASAAVSGLRIFKRFGVRIDGGPINPENKRDMREVRYGEKLHELVRKDKVVADETVFLFESLSILICDKDVYGLGITASPIIQAGKDGPEILAGFSRRGGSALLSLAGIRRLDNQLIDKAISVGAAHEMGHVLGRDDHCGKEDCIMRENQGGEGTLAAFVSHVQEICSGCMEMIGRYISETRR